ncbi:hypothetical protein ACHMXB_20790 [Arthrobacter sp. UC242_113]
MTITDQDSGTRPHHRCAYNRTRNMEPARPDTPPRTPSAGRRGGRP